MPLWPTGLIFVLLMRDTVIPASAKSVLMRAASPARQVPFCISTFSPDFILSIGGAGVGASVWRRLTEGEAGVSWDGVVSFSPVKSKIFFMAVLISLKLPRR